MKKIIICISTFFFPREINVVSFAIRFNNYLTWNDFEYVCVCVIFLHNIISSENYYREMTIRIVCRKLFAVRQSLERFNHGLMNLKH